MILFVEGARHSGKTFLINQFIEQCNDPRVEYYKFYFANHVKTLSIVDQDATPSLHYFSLGNIMTIMEMNLRPEYKDKIWVFDRAIISAYTWAILRNRLSRTKAEVEFLTLLKSNLYENSKTIVVAVAGQTEDSKRVKDTWDGAHSTIEEQQLMADLIDIATPELANSHKNNKLSIVFNRFDEQSIKDFNRECYTLLGIEPNK
jgi:hypothetical protein